MMKSQRDARKHGQFVPKQPLKYVGKYPIVMRSSWERRMSQWLDSNPSVLEWSSESIFIHYFDPVTKKNRRYFPDFYVMFKNKDGVLQKYIVEVKPFKETIPPTNRGKKSKKTKIYEAKTYSTNMAKWDAATGWCRKMGMSFITITEKDLFGR